MEHILLNNSIQFKYKNNDMMNNYFFDNVNGYWIEIKTHIPLMLSNNAPCLCTKKEDLETGEDLKGY